MGCPRFHSADIELPVDVAGQHDDRRAAAAGHHLPEQLQAGPGTEIVVQQAQPVTTVEERLDRAFKGRDPVDVHMVAVHVDQDRVGQKVIVLVVVDDQDPQMVVVHEEVSPDPFASGSATISIQYFPRTLMTLTRPSKVTGFVMNELTPRS